VGGSKIYTFLMGQRDMLWERKVGVPKMVSFSQFFTILKIHELSQTIFSVLLPIFDSTSLCFSKADLGVNFCSNSVVSIIWLGN
jgi:hypothetical protein